MSHSRWMRITISALFFLAALVTPIALRADVIATSGNVTLLPVAPTSIAIGARESSTTAILFREFSGVLTTAVTVDNNAPGTYRPNGAPGISLPSGTGVLTYLLHFDPVGRSRATVSGTFTFDSPIIGLIFSANRLGASDGILGLPGVTYLPTSARALEFGSTEYFSVSSDLHTISFAFLATTGVDQLRIVTALPVQAATEPVPEPSASLLVLAGVLLLLCGRLRRHAL